MNDNLAIQKLVKILQSGEFFMIKVAGESYMMTSQKLTIKKGKTQPWANEYEEIQFDVPHVEQKSGDKG